MLDLTGKKSGRGAYLCRSSACLKRAVKSRQLGRNLDCEIPDGIADELAVLIDRETEAEK